MLADHGRLSLAAVLGPAIALAEQGVPFTPFDHQMFSESGSRLTEEGVSTTHLAAVDAGGLAVNITQSLGHGFGSGVVVPGTGVCLNDAIYWFFKTPGHPNALAPGKTQEWPIAPLHLHRDGWFWGTLGTPGSYGILVTTVQVLVHLLDFGLNLSGFIPRGLPRLSSFRRKPESRETGWIPCQARNDM